MTTQQATIMGRSMKTLLISLSGLLLSVAGYASTERVYRGLYDGLQIREQLVNPSPAHGVRKDMPSTYSAYEA